MNKQKLSKEAHCNAILKGFKFGGKNTIPNLNDASGELDEADRHVRELGDKAWHYYNPNGGYNTVEYELADCAIRLLAIAYEHGVEWGESPLTRVASYPACKISTFTELSFYVKKLIGKIATLTIHNTWVIRGERIEGAIDALLMWSKNEGINLERYIEEKMKYNKTRPYLHGRELV